MDVFYTLRRHKVCHHKKDNVGRLEICKISNEKLIYELSIEKHFLTTTVREFVFKHSHSFYQLINNRLHH